MKASAPPNDTGSARHQRPASTVEEGLRLVLATPRRSLIAKIATKGSHCSRHTGGRKMFKSLTVIAAFAVAAPSDPLR